MKKDELEIYNSMFYWWPKVKKLGIPVPRTVLYKLDRESFIELMMVVNTDKFTSKSRVILDKVRDVIMDMGIPCFVRGDMTSDKHEWNETCFINTTDRNVIHRNLANLIASHDMHIGMYTGIAMYGYAVREMLDTKPVFYYFNGTPITKERRYFYSNGEVCCFHPYWPRDAIEKGYGKDLPKDWSQKLGRMNSMNKKEIDKLTGYAKRIGDAISNDDVRSWSIDFLQDRSGKWYFIDAAIAERSFHWDGCEVAKEKGWTKKPGVVSTIPAENFFLTGMDKE